jgi:D-serine deaminase-like pyridoxal phosphate-dependent protein
MSSWIDKVSTPALIVYYETLIKNIKSMAKFAKENNMALRPHVKTHKCPKIGKLQLNAGAHGISVATVGEAEVFTQNGFEDILIANEVVEINQIKRLVELNKKSLIRVCVDSKKNINDLNQMAAKEGVKLEVRIELNVGMNRAGVTPGMPALELANNIKEKSNLTLIGLQTYEGHLTTMANIEQQKFQTEECMTMALETRDLLRNNGFDITTITARGSATYRFSAKVEGITEIQPGTYVFSDDHLHRVNTDFDIAATVLATVSNQMGNNEYTLDSGSKAVSKGDGKSIFKDYPKAKIGRVTEEHTEFKLLSEDVLEIGKKIELIPAHICPTVNLYDFLTVIKKDGTVERWDILARGKNY